MYLNNKFCKYPNTLKFNELMNTNNVEILKSLAKFLMLSVLPELKLYLCLCNIPFLHTLVTLTCNITVYMYIFVCVPHVPLNWY
jgi:hypothetical protein